MEKARLHKELAASVQELQAERTIGADTAELLSQAKAHEADLLEERQQLQSLIENLETRLKAESTNASDKTNEICRLQKQCDQAQEALLALKADKEAWLKKEAELQGNASVKKEEWQETSQALKSTRQELAQVQQALTHREAEIQRSSERAQMLQKELQQKLSEAHATNQSQMSKHLKMSDELRTNQARISELVGVASDLETRLSQKDSSINTLTKDLDSLRQKSKTDDTDKITMSEQVLSLQNQLSTAITSRDKLSFELKSRTQELDELRQTFEAKMSDDVKRDQIEESRAKALSDLRMKYTALDDQASLAASTAAQDISNLRAALMEEKRNHEGLRKVHNSLTDRFEALQTSASASERALEQRERELKAIEAEVRQVRSRQVEVNAAHEEAIKARDVSSK